MASLPKRDLLAQLADNNSKQISATDVSSIVTTMYQPTLIYHGTLEDATNRQVIEYYFNPDYFQKKGYNGNTSGQPITSSTQIYQFTNQGTGVPSGWSAPITATNVTPSTSGGKGLQVMIFGAGGVVTDYQVVVQGGGYRPGDQLRLSITGASVAPIITYRAAIRYFSQDVYNMTYNVDNGFHTGINSIPQMVPYNLTVNADLEDIYCRVGDLNESGAPLYESNNTLKARAGYNTNRYAMNITLWRINGA
tara:strand:- start:1473 stop:2222 length:750 start_codon:yes stop_codon:yes gene_type:complete